MQLADFDRIASMLDRKLAPLENALAASREDERRRDATMQTQLKKPLEDIGEVDPGATAREVRDIIEPEVARILAAIAPPP